jgi:hypothetical protein
VSRFVSLIWDGESYEEGWRVKGRREKGRGIQSSEAVP